MCLLRYVITPDDIKNRRMPLKQHEVSSQEKWKPDLHSIKAFDKNYACSENAAAFILCKFHCLAPTRLESFVSNAFLNTKQKLYNMRRDGMSAILNFTQSQELKRCKLIHARLPLNRIKNISRVSQSRSPLVHIYREKSPAYTNFTQTRCVSCCFTL